MKEANRPKKAQVISFYPNGEFFYQRGMTCFEKGDLNRASKYMERALKIRPNDVEYLCQQAAIMSELEQYDSSIGLLKKVVCELDTHMTECYFFMANNYAYMGAFDEALDAAKLYMTLEPHGAFSDEARQLCDMLSSDDELPDDEPAYVEEHEKGRMALEHGRFTEAAALFQRVLKLNPDFLAAQNNLSIAYFSTGNINQALAETDLVLSKDPGNVHALCNMATFFYQEGDTPHLKQILNRLDSLYPMVPEHCGKLGSTYLYLGEYRKAYRWLRIAEKRGVHCDQVFRFWLALAAFHSGDRKQAEKNWKRVDYFSNKPFHPFKYNKIQDMMFEESTADNFMVKDLLRKEIWENNLSYQLFSLFYLSHHGDAQLLADTARKGPTPQIRDIAGRLLEENQTGMKNSRLEIMRIVEKLTGGEKEAMKQPEIYSFWSVVDSVIGPDKEADSLGWAAALYYLWEKEFGVKTSQKKVADLAGTTVYRIRKHIGVLSQVLNRKWEEELVHD
ncbi:tetratricopeptide repeat protein [Sporolactobacillus sp. Y61]|uniref:Tetratricopeptide repeat protein n=1 Tax=Sporolactobacillus sp. Y61 TaxID=3160863 RepID=A0AAU8IBR8_9BACL